MEETSEKLTNFSIGIDLLGPDPTSSKNKAELKKKLASSAFRKFVEDQLQQTLAERGVRGSEKEKTTALFSEHLMYFNFLKITVSDIFVNDKTLSIYQHLS